MFWTWDSYREHAAAWARAPRKNRDALSRFFAKVDLMFYAAATAFAGCVIALIVS
jgi:hypothetical protein